jgi:hypothetical protein
MRSPYEQLVNQIFSRIDRASGPYQMVAVLGDGVVFRCPAAETTVDDAGGATSPRTLDAEYFEEVPVEYFHQRFDGLPRFVWHFGYAEQRRRLHETMEGGTLFQVHLWWYPGDCTTVSPSSAPPTDHADGAEPRKKELLRLGESVHTRWGSQDLRVRAGTWLWEKLDSISLTLPTPAETGGSASEGGPADAVAAEDDRWWVHPAMRSQETTAEPTDHSAPATTGSDANQVAPLVDISMGWDDVPEMGTGWPGGVVDLNMHGARRVKITQE